MTEQLKVLWPFMRRVSGSGSVAVRGGYHEGLGPGLLDSVTINYEMVEIHVRRG